MKKVMTMRLTEEDNLRLMREAMRLGIRKPALVRLALYRRKKRLAERSAPQHTDQVAETS